MTTVDWSRPIEAVHEDGRVMAVSLRTDVANPDHEGDYVISIEGRDQVGGFDTFRPDGLAWSHPNSGWRIRNVTLPNSALPNGEEVIWQNSGSMDFRIPHVISTAPVSPTPTALVDRMVSLVRDMAKYGASTFVGCGSLVENSFMRARAIVSDPGFPAEVDAVREEAIGIVKAHPHGSNASEDGWLYRATVEVADTALRRGKQLAGEV